MELKQIYKVELSTKDGKKEVFNVVGSDVETALHNLRWSKGYEYDSDEYKEWSDKVSKAVSVSLVMTNVIG